MSYLAITTLLAQMSLMDDILYFSGLIHLSGCSAHTLRHILICRTLWLRHVQKLQLQLTDNVRRPSDWTRVRTTLAAHAIDDLGVVFERPFVIARHIDSQLTSDA